MEGYVRGMFTRQTSSVAKIILGNSVKTLQHTVGRYTSPLLPVFPPVLEHIIVSLSARSCWFELGTMVVLKRNIFKH